MQRLFMRWSVVLSVALFCVGNAGHLHAKVITLVNDVVHNGVGSPFEIPERVHGDKLVITSTSHKAVIIRKGSTWDLSDLSSTYKTIEFAGNARLVCEPGSRLHGTGGVLRFVDEARFIVGKE